MSPAAEVELLGLHARELREHRLAVGQLQLDAHLEAEVADPRRPAPRGRRGRRGSDRDVVRAHERAVEARDRPEEAHHEAVRGPVVELARAADLLDPGVVHHRDVVGDRHRLLLVVRDEQRGDVDLVVQPAQPLAQLRADLGVERAERLVEQQHAAARRRARGRAPSAGAGRRRAATGSAWRGRRGRRSSAARGHAPRSCAFGSLRIRSPKPTLSRTVMCLKAA